MFSYPFRGSFNYLKSVTRKCPDLTTGFQKSGLSQSVCGVPHSKSTILGLAFDLIWGYEMWEVFCWVVCNMSSLGIEINRRRQSLSFRWATWDFFSQFWWSVIKARSTKVKTRNTEGWDKRNVIKWSLKPSIIKSSVKVTISGLPFIGFTIIFSSF